MIPWLVLSSLCANPIINVKFGNGGYTGGGALQSSNHWNFFSLESGSTLNNLSTSSGESTSSSLRVTYATTFGGSFTSSTSPEALLGSGLYGPYSFRIANLDPSLSYNLYVYVYNKSNESTTIAITTPGGGPNMSKSPTPVNNLSSFILNQNYVIFSNIKPTPNGNIYGEVLGGWTGLNGLQIETIPNAPKTLSIDKIGDSIRISFSGVLEMSENLVDWSDVDPQTKSPWLFRPLDQRMFFRIKP